MNASELTYLLNHPEKSSEVQLLSIKKIIQEYPYFQAARAAYLKIIKHQDHFEYHNMLKHTAAHTTDRTVLFELINPNVSPERETETETDKKTEALNAMEVYFETLVVEEVNKETSAVLDPDLFYPKSDTTETKKTIVEESSLKRSSEFSDRELHSFAEWLKRSSLKTIDRDHSLEEIPKTVKKEKFRLIDKFIAKNPKITPKREAVASPNLSKVKEVEKTDLMTETLAKIYLKQKKFKKAIQAYKILSLKYPEKSGFFADQIKAVKKLQQNN